MARAFVYLMVWATLAALVVSVVAVIAAVAVVVGLVMAIAAIVRAIRDRRVAARGAAETERVQLLARMTEENEQWTTGDLQGLYGQFPPVDDGKSNAYLLLDAAHPVAPDPTPSLTLAWSDPSLETALAESGMTPGQKRKACKLAAHLSPGELVTAVAFGIFESGQATVALTDRRLLILGKNKLTEIPLADVSYVGWTPKLMYGVLTVEHRGRTTTPECVKSDGALLAGLARAQVRARTA